MDIDKLSNRAIKEMLSIKPTTPAVTIYLPTHRSAAPSCISEDEIRFKNLHAKAKALLKVREDSRQFISEFDNMLNSLAGNLEFWEHQTEGLLICSRPRELRLFHLPLDCEEYLAVADQFHLASVFGILNDLRDYYVLVVAQHSPRLLRGDFYGLQPAGVELLSSIKAGLKIDEMDQKNEQQVSSYGNRQGYNGRGGSKNPAEEERQRFWRVIDDRINKQADRNLPLLLAGIESEVSEYRAASRFPAILGTHIEGSFSGANPRDLFPKALEIILKEIINPEHNRIIKEYKELRGRSPGLVERDFATINKAAAEGRIDKLLLSGVRYTTDTIRENIKSVPLVIFPPEESAQAINEIARIVYGSSGTIVNIEQTHMPVKGAQILAVMRY